MKRKKSLKTLRRLAWQACSLYIRQFYADHKGYCVCFTCGKSSHFREMDAGHAIPGRHNQVLFDTDIIRVQCKICNIWKGGNLHIFSTRLIKEHGLEWWETKLTDARNTLKYYRDDYERLIEQFTQKTSVIEKSKKWSKP